MASDINEVIINGALDIGAFTSLGFISGHGWKAISQGSPTSFVKELGLSSVEPLGTAIVCGLFAAIDRLVHGILLDRFKGNQINHPVFSILRISGSAWGSIKIFNLISTSLNLAKIETRAGAFVVITAIAVNTIIRPYIFAHNNRE